MSVLAGDAAPAAAAAAGDAGAPRGVRLAIAIVLLWLACFCFFIAFEGQQLLGADADLTGGGLARAMITGLAARAQAAETQGG